MPLGRREAPGVREYATAAFLTLPALNVPLRIAGHP